MTDEKDQGVHQVGEEDHQKIEEAITDEDMYGRCPPGVPDILPSPPQRQNEDTAVGNQRGNPERGCRRFFSSLFLKDGLWRIETHERSGYSQSICSLTEVSKRLVC